MSTFMDGIEAAAIFVEAMHLQRVVVLNAAEKVVPLADAIRALTPPEPPRDERANWCFDMTLAPRDGTLLQLLIQFETDDWFDGFDDDNPSRTFGFNNFDHDGEDKWQFPAWSWDHDCILAQGHGRPIAWASMLPLPPAGGA